MSGGLHLGAHEAAVASGSRTPVAFTVRGACTDDVDAVKRLADAHRRELGFVVRASLIEACRRGELLVAVTQGTNARPRITAPSISGAAAPAMPTMLEAVAPARSDFVPAAVHDALIGFVQAYFRRDGQATLHTIAVDGAFRRHGVGRALVAALIDASRRRGMVSILLRCPIDLAANTFYASIGFSQERIEQGKRRQLAVWTCSLR